jgi:hypothetical protein
MIGGETAPGHQLLREPGQIAPGALVDAGKTRHDVAEQKGRDCAADHQQDRRIDQRADQPPADDVELAVVFEITGQRARQAGCAFRRPHQADVERWEMFGLPFEGGRKALAFPQVAQQPFEHAPCRAARLLVTERLDGLGERQAGFEQREQFLAEQGQRKRTATVWQYAS